MFANRKNVIFIIKIWQHLDKTSKISSQWPHNWHILFPENTIKKGNKKGKQKPSLILFSPYCFQLLSPNTQNDQTNICHIGWHFFNLTVLLKTGHTNNYEFWFSHFAVCDINVEEENATSFSLYATASLLLKIIKAWRATWEWRNEKEK